jgi:murein DD-endopeptidase MepM/ murein hydrolase activator NlpD
MYLITKILLIFGASKIFVMRRMLYLVFLTCCLGCSKNEAPGYFTTEKASDYFKSIEELCLQENGRLWGKNLYGPVMFVDRSNRRIIANFPDAEGHLKGHDGIYTGIYPNELIIYNEAVVFGGTTFAMVPVPTEENKIWIKARSIHALFHCFQKANGYENTFTVHDQFDEKDARLWIKLELKALRKAIVSEGEERVRAIRDALVFRNTNRELFGVNNDELRYETREGLATFTDMKFTNTTPTALKNRLLENLDWMYSMNSYSIFYGNTSGSIYSALLYDAGFDFKSIIIDSVDLGNLVQQAYKVELPQICRDVAGSLGLCYDFDKISEEEEERMNSIHEELHKLTSTFTGKQVVYIELLSPYFDFEPEDVHPVDSMGTLYSSIRISDNWGKLTVDKGGCLISGSNKYIRMTAKDINIIKNRVEGNGWNLLLNQGWELSKVDQNYILRNLIAM